ncbi:MAG: hypothetical protein RIS25_111 [Actinomycetota bacterium]
MKRIVGNEQYFTPNDVARSCVERVDRLFPLSGFDRIVEPSAGDGVFLRFLPSSTIAVDIEPQSDSIVRADFVYWNPPSLTGAPSRTLVIGNPPFGQRAALAMSFIQHAAEFADVIAFILPMSFNKYTFQDRVPRNFHLVESTNLTVAYDVAAQENESTPTPKPRAVTVNTVFQVWEKRAEARAVAPRITPHPDFTMKHAHLAWTTEAQRQELRDAHDFAIAQVGANFAPKDVDSVTKGSHWFVRGMVPGVREVFERLDFSHLSGMNTAHTSLSKRDIIEAYSRALETRPSSD